MSVVSVPTSVVVAFGNDTVLSAVGSTTVNIVSCASADAPSKSMRPRPAGPPPSSISPAKYAVSDVPFTTSLPLAVTCPVTLMPVGVVATFALWS